MVRLEKQVQTKRRVNWWFLLETVLLVGVFWLSHGSPPPDVNESHYLIKAKHYWNPEFAPTDFFLSSADAHLVFYWAFGWLTLLMDLEAVAWIGRLFSWTLLAASLVSIGRRIAQPAMSGLFVGGLFVVLTEYGHMAGEWVIGGFEGKTVAYGLSFWAIRASLDRRWGVSWVLGGLASAFHVLAGGWIVLCLLVVRAMGVRKELKLPCTQEWGCLILGGVLALGGLVPGLLLSSGNADVAAEANRLYVHVWLPHHLVITSFATHRVVAFFSLVCGLGLAWFFSAKWRQDEHGVVAGLATTSLLLVVIGILVTLLLGNDSPIQHSLLRFYFYRTSDVLVPLAAAVLACVVVFNVSKEIGSGIRLRGSILVLLLGIYVGESLHRRYWDPRPRGDVLTLPASRKADPVARRDNTMRIHRHWKLACQWIRNNTPSDAIALTPLRQQTFKWYSQRGEIVTRKDMPQDAISLLQWHERRESVYPMVDDRRGLSRVSNDELIQSCHKYGADYMVLTQFSEESRNRFDGDFRVRKMFPPEGKFSYYAVFRVYGSK